MQSETGSGGLWSAANDYTRDTGNSPWASQHLSKVKLKGYKI